MIRKSHYFVREKIPLSIRESIHFTWGCAYGMPFMAIFLSG
jgi:hypothetical protein